MIANSLLAFLRWIFLPSACEHGRERQILSYSYAMQVLQSSVISNLKAKVRTPWRHFEFNSPNLDASGSTRSSFYVIGARTWEHGGQKSHVFFDDQFFVIYVSIRHQIQGQGRTSEIYCKGKGSSLFRTWVPVCAHSQPRLASWQQSCWPPCASSNPCCSSAICPACLRHLPKMHPIQRS